jgi:hypothetical protein
MKCIFCGEEFTADGIKSTCGACGENRTCQKVRCPACGEDNPRIAELVVMIKDLVKDE